MYKTVVRPAMMYGAETWAAKKAEEKKLDVGEMGSYKDVWCYKHGHE